MCPDRCWRSLGTFSDLTLGICGRTGFEIHEALRRVLVSAPGVRSLGFSFVVTDNSLCAYVPFLAKGNFLVNKS